MAKGTGIEIGATAVTVAEVEGSAKKFRVTGAGRAEFGAPPAGEERIKAIAQAARAAMKAARAARDQVVLSIPACDVIIREIQLPFTEEEQIRKVIKFESESHLHSCDIDDVVVGFQKISESGPRSRVLIFAIKKADIRNALDALDRVGIDPIHVTIDAAALFSVWRALPAGESEGTNVILDVGAVTTTALVTVGEKVRLVRGIRLGTETIAKSVATDLGVPPDEAREKTAQFAAKSGQVFALAGELEEQDPAVSTSTSVLQRDIIRDSHGGFSDRIANELRRSLSSVLLDGKLDAIWLTGSGAAAPGLEGALGRAFDVPVRRLETLEGVDHKLAPELADVVTVPIGLGLKALGHDPLALDFRQEEFKFARKFDRLKWVLTMGLALLLFLFVFLLIHELLESREIQRKQLTVADYAKSIAKKRYLGLLGDPALAKILRDPDKKGAEQTPAEIEKRLDNVPADRVVAEISRLVNDSSSVLEKKYGYKPGEDTAGPDIAASALQRLAAWNSCFKNLPQLTGKFAINRLSANSSEITWDMDLADTTDWELLNECFKSLPGVVEVQRASDRPVPPGAQPGMTRRLEGNKLVWPREGK
jgi:type IV pilus assembly protein PilM